MATATDFNVGQAIQNSGMRKGVVIGNQLSDGNQVVAIEWSDGSLGKVNVNDLQKCLSIEEEFALLQTQVNDLLNEAAKLIREASDLADEHGKSLHDSDDYDNLFETGVIEEAMSDAGWNTSSWHC